MKEPQPLIVSNHAPAGEVRAAVETSPESAHMHSDWRRYGDLENGHQSSEPFLNSPKNPVES